jgi:hypothetical protein
MCFLAIYILESEFHKRQKNSLLEESEIVTAVAMKDAIFWDITPNSPLKVNRRFEESSRLLLQS